MGWLASAMIGRLLQLNFGIFPEHKKNQAGLKWNSDFESIYISPKRDDAIAAQVIEELSEYLVFIDQSKRQK